MAGNSRKKTNQDKDGKKGKRSSGANRSPNDQKTKQGMKKKRKLEDASEHKEAKKQRQKTLEAQEIVSEGNNSESTQAQARQLTTVTFCEEENEYVEMNVEDNEYLNIIEDDDSEEEGEISFNNNATRSRSQSIECGEK